jgi:hypothetical protein
MKRLIAEWLWRVAVLCALGGLAWQLQRIHEDIVQPAEDPATVASAQTPEDVQESLDAVRDDLATIERKVDAILVVMARAK